MTKRTTSAPSEADFLRDYDASVFPRPSVAVDLVVTSVDSEGRLLVLLVKRKEHPYLGRWSLPGGFVRQSESVAGAATRVLSEKAGLSDVELDELRTFSTPGRDPRGWVISIAHLALVPSDRIGDVRAGGAAEDASFFLLSARGEAPGFRLAARDPSRDAPATLAFDHDAILSAAIARLRQRVTTTTLAFGLLPARFTLDEARRAVEAILGKRIDKAAFRTKVLSLGLVRPTTEERRGGAHRPARLYVAASGWEVVT
jgi:8-oxo-dGTP diphosphatase